MPGSWAGIVCAPAKDAVKKATKIHIRVCFMISFSPGIAAQTNRYIMFEKHDTQARLGENSRMAPG